MNTEQTPQLEPPSGSNPIATFLTVVGGAILLVAGFMFSLVVLAIGAIVALVVLGVMWWKTRALRRHLREQMTQMQQEHEQGFTRDAGPGDGVIIEGEVIREDPRLPH